MLQICEEKFNKPLYITHLQFDMCSIMVVITLCLGGDLYLCLFSTYGS